MTANPLQKVIQHLRSLAAGKLSDSRLLQLFIGNADQAAFAALVRIIAVWFSASADECSAQGPTLRMFSRPRSWSLPGMPGRFANALPWQAGFMALPTASR